MLIDKTIFGEINKVENAIARIKINEPPEGYYVAFSGGKDSCVVLDLVKKAKVKYDAHFNVTTVDPPELIRFIVKEHPEVIIEKPKRPMWKAVAEKGILPTRTMRFCCAEFKEHGGEGRTVITGVRWAESVRRRKTKLLSERKCQKHASKILLNPIIDWTTAEVWEYIFQEKLKYCCLYDQGFKRIGCVGCPMAPAKERKKELEAYPHLKKQWLMGAEEIVKRKNQNFSTAGELFEWWLSGKSLKNWKCEKEFENLFFL